MNERLNDYLKQWNLSEPALLAQTPTSHVYTVRQASGEIAVLKLLTAYGWEERSGAAALQHWGGHGAARLLCSDDEAQLIEYIDGSELVTLVERGKDEAATQIIADVLNQLHDVPLDGAGEGLFTLERWFRELFNKAEADRAAGSESIYVRGATMAEHLLAEPRDVCVLHGDIHHRNIRYSTTRGWLAYDPKGLVGERAYDCANTLVNPYPYTELVHNEARLLRNATILANQTGLDRNRLLAFTFAYACLSASWSLSDDSSDARGAAAWALKIAEIVEPHVNL